VKRPLVLAIGTLAALLVLFVLAPGAWAQPAPAPAPDPSAAGDDTLKLQGRPIERVQFRGNRKVEDDAIRVQLLSKAGTLLDAAKLREDLRAMWKLGFFADIDVEAEVAQNGGVTLTFAVKEKPAIRKVLIAGHNDLGLDKINEVIDLEIDAIVDISKVKKNRQKIADLYVQKGFYLATVDYEVKPVNEAEVDVWFKVDEKSKVKIREVQFIGNSQLSDDELRSSIQTRRPDALSFLNDSGTYS
jgi:outer membrane protein insertion porin family